MHVRQTLALAAGHDNDEAVFDINFGCHLISLAIVQTRTNTFRSKSKLSNGPFRMPQALLARNSQFIFIYQRNYMVKFFPGQSVTAQTLYVPKRPSVAP